MMRISIELFGVYFISFVYFSFALRNSSCKVTSSLLAILKNNIYLDATKTDCDDHMELSIRQTIKNMNQPSNPSVGERGSMIRNKIKGETGNRIAKLQRHVNPLSNLRTLSAPGTHNCKYF